MYGAFTDISRSRRSSVCTVIRRTKWTIGGWNPPSPQGGESHFFCETSIPAVWPLCLPSIRYWSSFPGLKRPEREVSHAHLLLRLRIVRAVHPIPPYAFMVCVGTDVCLIHFTLLGTDPENLVYVEF